MWCGVWCRRPMKETIVAVSIVGLVSAQMAAGGGAPLDADVDLWRFAATQGGLFIALLVVVYFYRRAFLKQVSAESTDRAELRRVLEKNTEAASDQATQSARMVDAMNRLSRGIEGLEREHAIQRVAERPMAH